MVTRLRSRSLPSGAPGLSDRAGILFAARTMFGSKLGRISNEADAAGARGSVGEPFRRSACGTGAVCESRRAVSSAARAGNGTAVIVMHADRSREQPCLRWCGVEFLTRLLPTNVAF